MSFSIFGMGALGADTAPRHLLLVSNFCTAVGRVGRHGCTLWRPPLNGSFVRRSYHERSK